jgi:tetratricopeptide (TPR) repeat protein
LTLPDSLARQTALAALYVLAGDDDSAKLAYAKVAPSPSPTPKPAMSFLDQAKLAIHQHRYEDAEAHLLQWLAVHSTDRSARYSLAVVRRQISITQFARLVSIAPDSYQVHQMLGELYVSREEDDKALKEYLAVAAERPDLPGVHFWLGHLYWKHGDADHALIELTRELQLSPGHPEANGELGAVLVAQDRTTEAIPHLESAIHSKGDLWPAYPQLGRAYAAQKNYRRAEEILKRALAHDEDGSAHYQLGLVLRAEGKTVQANESFEQVRAIKREKMAAPSSGDNAEEGAKE